MCLNAGAYEVQHSDIMSDIVSQFKRAQDLDMLSELSEADNLIVATFCDKTRNYIIDAVVVHLNKKYGQHVYVAKSIINPKVVEVWYREMPT